MHEFFFGSGITPGMTIIPWYYLAIPLGIFLAVVYFVGKHKKAKATKGIF